MAYNIANNLRISTPDPIGVDQLKRKNALADMAAQTDQNRNALYAQQLTQNDARMKADQQAAMLEQVRAWAPGAYERVLANPAEAPAFIAQAQKLGITAPDFDVTKATPADVEQIAMHLGLAKPKAPPPINLGRKGGFSYLEQGGSVIPGSVDKPQPATSVSVAAQPQARRLTPQEAAAAGYAPGTVVQQKADGTQQVLQRPAPAAAQADAKIKAQAATRLPQLAALGRRLERLSTAVNSISDNMIFTGGVVSEKVLPYTKEGRELEAAVSQVRPLLTALTRVPGIGSQSDLEARLDGLQYPQAGLPSESNAANVAELEAFITDLSAAYQSLVGSGGGGGDGWDIQQEGE